MTFFLVGGWGWRGRDFALVILYMYNIYSIDRNVNRKNIELKKDSPLLKYLQQKNPFQ